METPRDAALSKDEPVASQPSDAAPKSTEGRTAETVESNTAARSGPETESQREASETKSQEARSEQGKAAVVAATGTVGTAPCAEEPGEKSSSTHLGYYIVTE